MMKPQGITIVFVVVLVVVIWLVADHGLALAPAGAALGRHGSLLLVCPMLLFTGYSL